MAVLQLKGSGQACGVLAVGYIHFPKDFFASFFGLQKMKKQNTKGHPPGQPYKGDLMVRPKRQLVDWRDQDSPLSQK